MAFDKKVANKINSGLVNSVSILLLFYKTKMLAKLIITHAF
jgi:hypothetical protein